MENEELVAILAKGRDVWNQWRKDKNIRIDLSDTDFSGANFTGINFDRAILKRVNFSGTDLRGANLSKSDLRDANFGEALLGDTVSGYTRTTGSGMLGASFRKTRLNKANLQGADLRQAIFRGVDLSEANLTFADLRDTIFTHVNLNLANLGEARFGRTAIIDTDLSNVKGLEIIKSEAHILNTLGADTLLKTKIPLPGSFLDAFGLLEPEIKANNYYSCFISYSHDDHLFARRVHDTLQGYGIRCWLDEKDMNPGDSLYEGIDNGIRSRDKVLLCCSKTALTQSGWVDTEVNKTLVQERELMRERGVKTLKLIPLDLDGFLFEVEYKGDKRDEIRSRVAADFRGWAHENMIFEREIERVIKALRIDSGNS